LVLIVRTFKTSPNNVAPPALYSAVSYVKGFSSHFRNIYFGCETSSAFCSKRRVESSPVVNPWGLEADHCHPSIVEVKNEWRRTSTSRLCLHDVSRKVFTSVFIRSLSYL